MYLDEFATRLMDLMEAEGVSKSFLSAQIQVDRRSIRLWLQGRFFPRYDAFIKLCNFFHVSADFLIGEEGSVFIPDYFSSKGVEIEQVPLFFLRKVENYMREQKLTKYALAKQVEIDPKSLGKWWTSGAMPELITIIKLAQLMKTSLSELLGQETYIGIQHEGRE